MNAAIDSGAPAPAVIRALQSQLDTCNQQIAQDHDDKQERQVKVLQDRIKELDNPPAVPPVSTPVTVPAQTDAEAANERRLAKLLKQLETPAVEPSAELNNATEAVRDRRAKEEAEKTAKAEAEKKAAEDKKAQRIAELKQARDDIYKNRSTPGFMQMAASNPAFTRDGNQALKDIAAELQQLEPSPVGNVPQFDAEEQKRENAARQKADSAEWNWAMGGYQTTRPEGR